ncbi:hypothetical protein [Aeromicrobium terrae]|uniref:Sulfotransferase family protein n=1 Tax=Aeromicrobium terrae TaxID=2498846 RepID=A0A5C8NDX8_9ACTN|nr:hypothetical protein [Aeromicrobium terrae]TXL56547.1 hypothetical protein FHP06_15500 [Aeromicrobium terrae]
MPPSDDLCVPDGTRLLHVGPHKTGTTSVQHAFHTSRPALARQGIAYAGADSQPMVQVQTLVDAYTDRDVVGSAKTLRPWKSFAREVRRSRARCVVVSSEFFADARPAAIERAVDDLGGGSGPWAERSGSSGLHVVVTLRPIAGLLASQWQQYVQSGLRADLDTWLTAMLHEADTTRLTPTFWWRHRHDRLVERWAAAVGTDHVTVVVADRRRPDHLLRVFEQLTGAAEGTLSAEDDLANRSLSWSEVELIREFNRQFTKAKLPKHMHLQAMRLGAARYLQARPRDASEPKVRAQQWALDEAAGIGAEMAGAIAASGVRVVGDLADLATTPEAGDGVAPTEVSTRLAAAAAMGVLHASGMTEPYRDPDELPVRPVPTRHVVRLGRARLRRKAKQVLSGDDDANG